MTGVAAGPVALDAGLDPADVTWGSDGLVAGVVQDEADGRVLMVGWLDAEALAATLATGEVHFHSRSRGRLWRKGESSGNVLRLRSLAIDCDGDALLLGVEPAGPTCHRGTRSCFDADADPARTSTIAPRTQGFAWLESLWATIAAACRRPARRARTRSRCSTAASTSPGARSPRRPRRSCSRPRTTRRPRPRARRATTPAPCSPARPPTSLYHALVLLAERGLEPRTVVEVLRARSAPHRESTLDVPPRRS